ncbi:MAG: SUMF1/EgtB/PvdO family nonheme iron enzyme [Ignavibacteriaceae bacterium]|nr:SUMF1/EgtB/PvdO family nonheme iron enzyme [Ignavibacteriaceae bacterium]
MVTIAVLILSSSLYFYSGSESPVKKNIIVPEDMILVEAGEFIMGAGHREWNKPDSDELFNNKVHISDFLIGKTEITNGEWAALMYPDSLFPDSLRNLPVVNISWFEAIEFCNKKSISERMNPAYTIDEKNGTVIFDTLANGYRLPTEAEWEFAARGGKYSNGYLFSGNDTADYIGWYEKNALLSVKPVKTKHRNETGIFDMSGNASEWCFTPYRIDPANALSIIKVGKSENAVVRGGNIASPQSYLRITHRDLLPVYKKNKFTGFRLARSI